MSDFLFGISFTATVGMIGYLLVKYFRNGHSITLPPSALLLSIVLLFSLAFVLGEKSIAFNPNIECHERQQAQDPRHKQVPRHSVRHDAHVHYYRHHKPYKKVLIGFASWYNLPGNRTATGALFDGDAHTCAMLAVPLGTRVHVHDRDTGQDTYCTVNDRGPYVAGRIIDLTPVEADELGMRHSGVHPVEVDVLS